MLLLPVTHLVNSSVARIRLNNTATLKCDLNSRKQERGRIIQLGEYLIRFTSLKCLFYVGNQKECME